MRVKRLSQEMLKLIACVTMLLDHIGAVLWPSLELRIVGRLAFPIYCFLLAEGSHYTKNPKRYGLRLLLGALLSELPFDLLFFGQFTWHHQSVMVTLLLGFLALEAGKVCTNSLMKFLCVVVFALLAEWANTDYGAMGVLLIGVFAFCRAMPRGKIFRCFAVAAVLYQIPGASLQITRTFRFPIEMFALLSLIPIHVYSGQKATASKAVQLVFYLFYPVHLMLLWVIQVL